jgi:glycosyltransferase involved in cell wall biosynthesis
VTTPERRRILHVVGSMDRGGIETWLMHILRNANRQRLQMDFLVHLARPGAYDDEIRALGGAILPCPHLERPWRYAAAFARILRDTGPYDAVHSHVHHFSGYVLRLAHRAGIPGRVAHSHNDTSAIEARANLARRSYFALMRRWLRRHATHCLAASCEAAAALYGPGRIADPRVRVLHYGIALAPFAAPVDRGAVRAELGLTESDFVIGHVGRFVEQKNHRFLIEIAAAVVAREPRARLLLIGDGPLRPAIARQVASAGISSQVVFAGLRADVPRLMRGAMDAFILPSLHEGLGLVGIEAQASGLPVMLSDTITEEIAIIPPLIRRLALAAPAVDWADVLLGLRDARPPIAQREALRLVERSSFNIHASLQSLERVYADI